MNWKKYLSIIGILILIYLFYKVGITKIWGAAFDANVYYLILAFIFSFIILLLPAFKWALILKKQKIKIDFLTLVKIDLIGMFYGIITPGRIGTFLRAFYLRDKIKKPLGFCSSSIILDKLLDLMAIAVFATLGAFLILNKISILAPTLIFLFFLVAGLIYFLNKERSKFVLKLFYSYIIPKRFKKLAKESFHSFYDRLPKLRYLILPFVIALISYILFYTLNYLVAISLDIQIPYTYFITLSALATLISLLPITIAGIGTREVTLVILFNLFNISPEKTIAMSIIAFVLSTLSIALLGGYFSLKYD